MVLTLNRKEFGFIFITLLVVILATYLNLLTSFLRARDSQRKGDIRAIANALDAYQIDIASFPASSNGKIVACLAGVDESGIPQRKECQWGVDGLRDIFYEDANYPDYIKTLPSDPHTKDGASYLYLSNGRHYQIFTSLEGEDEAEYNPEIVARNLPCGTKVCNYGLSDKDTPLAISVEEYENELRAKYEKYIQELKQKK